MKSISARRARTKNIRIYIAISICILAAPFSFFATFCSHLRIKLTEISDKIVYKFQNKLDCLISRLDIVTNKLDVNKGASNWRSILRRKSVTVLFWNMTCSTQDSQGPGTALQLEPKNYEPVSGRRRKLVNLRCTARRLHPTYICNFHQARLLLRVPVSR